MKKLLYIDLFCGAGGTSTGVNTARLNGEQCAEVIACVKNSTERSEWSIHILNLLFQHINQSLSLPHEQITRK